MTLINYNEKKLLTRIQAHYKIEIEERPLPSNEDVENLVAQRLIGQLEARLRERDRLQVERMQRFGPLVKQLVEDEDGLALLMMLLDDTYHSWMYKPPELPPVGTPKKSGQSHRQKRKPRRRRRDSNRK
jgi:ATP-dependent RNA helicase DeaD